MVCRAPRRRWAARPPPLRAEAWAAGIPSGSSAARRRPPTCGISTRPLWLASAGQLHAAVLVDEPYAAEHDASPARDAHCPAIGPRRQRCGNRQRSSGFKAPSSVLLINPSCSSSVFAVRSVRFIVYCHVILYPSCLSINAPEGCRHGTHTNGTAYIRGTYSRALYSCCSRNLSAVSPRSWRAAGDLDPWLPPPPLRLGSRTEGEAAGQRGALVTHRKTPPSPHRHASHTVRHPERAGELEAGLRRHRQPQNYGRHAFVDAR